MYRPLMSAIIYFLLFEYSLKSPFYNGITSYINYVDKGALYNNL